MDGGAPQGVDDPGMIFRLITGAKGMRDIDADGCLLEQDDGAGGASESAAVHSELSALRTEVSSIKAGMGEMRTMLRQLLDAKDKA